MNGKVDIREALRLKCKGLSYAKVAEELGVSAGAVHKRIQALIPDKNAIEGYKEKKADILADLQLRLLENIDPELIKKSSVRDRVVSAGILIDKERLERGQSTSNMALALGQIDASDAGSARDFIAKQIANALTSEDKRAND